MKRRPCGSRMAAIHLGLAMLAGHGPPHAWAAALPAAPVDIGPDEVESIPMMELSVAEAVRTALEHSPELAAVRLEPGVFEATAVTERALFDPLLSVMVGRRQEVARDLSSSGILFDYRTDDLVGEALITQELPAGQLIELEARSNVVDASRDGQVLVEARLGGMLRQPLLRGIRPSANLGRARALGHEAAAARWEAQAFALELAALVEHACWDLALARSQAAVVEVGVAQARELLEEIRQRVDSGFMARTELVAAESEIALREQAQAEIRAELEVMQAYLAGHLALYGAGVPLELRITDPFVTEEPAESVAASVAAGLSRRPDLAAARELARRTEVEVSRTKHNLLPRVDLLVEAATVGYADDSSEAWDNLDGDHWTFTAGVVVEQALRNRDDRADHRREQIRRLQARETVRGLERLVETEVRAAAALARRMHKLVQATALTRALDDQKLLVEKARFDLGRASSFQVARAQRDLLERRLDELAAIAEQRKALVELFRAQGRLLERYGVVLDGVDGTAEEEPR